jgi:hypothetical protein
MSFTLTSPITGSAQTGFTAPTYTHVSDFSPDNNGKQVAVSALGGTQVGVTFHSVSSPFLLNMIRPRVFQSLGKPNLNGLITKVPVNVFKLITLKGVTPAVNQPYQKLQITTIISVPAGSDTYDAPNVRAALSAHIGGLSQQSAGLGDTLITGVV